MSRNRPWFVIAGGGTGGHLYPGLAVAESLCSFVPGAKITVFGTTRPIDEKLVSARGYELVKQDVRPFTAKPWRWPGFLAGWQRSVRAARERFKESRPAGVLGLGGYAAGPPVVVASRMKIPSAIFNPDAAPGRANRALSGKVNRVFVQWEETRDRFPSARSVQCTGCPIRPAFEAVQREDSYRKLKLDPAKKTLLITGASQGARSINLAMLELIDDLRKAALWQIVHITGSADLQRCREGYAETGLSVSTIDFTENMPGCMAVADLVISRAGASSLAEIAAMRLPSILMPYPYDRKQHQMANAQVLARGNATEIVQDSGDPATNAKRLRGVLRDLMHSDEKRRRLGRAVAAFGRFDSADVIAREMLELAGLVESD